MKRLLIILIVVIFSSCDKNENLTPGLIGKWKWTYWCVSGFAGVMCDYADENTTRNIQITKDKMIETFDTNNVTTRFYSVTSKTNLDDYTEYQIRFDDETTCLIKVTKNTLEIGSGTTWSGYEK